MNEHNLREIKLPFDHMFDEPLAGGRKVMTRRPVKTKETGALAKVKEWENNLLTGRYLGHEDKAIEPVIRLFSQVGMPGDRFKHETADGKILTFEVQSVRIERLWDTPEHEAELEGFENTIKFFKAWAKFYPPGSPFASTENPWVWACTFKRVRGFVGETWG